MKRLILAFSLVGAAPAWALDYDPTLSRLCVLVDPTSPSPCSDTPVADQRAFGALSEAYGLAMAPRLLAPAETLGINGFAFAFQFGLTGVDESASFWDRGVRANEDTLSPPERPGSLQTAHLDLRKGLPYSLELGAHLTHLLHSALFGIGGSLKVALNEGVNDVPIDVAVRIGASRIVGSGDLDMTLGNLDLIASHRIGLQTLSLTPYLAYSPLLIFASSGVVDSSPGDSTTPSGTFVFDDESLVLHRLTLGLRVLYGALALTPELVVASGSLATNLNIGLDF
ncbi:MAG: hypothetical protein ACI9U2_001895 [Bradymonadia bacterium]|jgi:hypothetical protein